MSYYQTVLLMDYVSLTLAQPLPNPQMDDRSHAGSRESAKAKAVLAIGSTDKATIEQLSSSGYATQKSRPKAMARHKAAEQTSSVNTAEPGIGQNRTTTD
ncbi:hypothetical protein BBP40_005566 [Aspergillus hancockii]|nr:hypothetical protein BBP40_005566 [Aspergillus hancockii]